MAVAINPKEAENLIAAGPISEEAASQTREVETTVIPVKKSEEFTTDTELDKKEFNIADFESIKDKSGVAPKPVVKEEEEIKTEVKPVVTPPEETRPKTAIDFKTKVKEVTTTAQPDEHLQSGDYTDFEQQMFKKMSNDAREYFQARVKDLRKTQTEVETLKKTGTKGLPEAYYHHEHAFVLDPEYQKSVAAANQMSSLVSHYESQLSKIKQGEPWQDLQVTADGKFTTIERQADTNAEVYALRKIQELDAYKRQYEQTANTLKSTFSSRVKEIGDKLVSLETEYFPQFSDPKVKDTHQHLKEITEIMSTKGFAKDPLFGMFTKLYASFMDLVEAYETLEKSNVKHSKIEALRKSAGPSTAEVSEVAAGGSVDPDKMEFDAKQWERYKQ